MSWPRCSECGSPDVRNVDGPGYAIERGQILVYRSHECPACGWKAWTCQTVIAEGTHLVGTIRAKFGGFNAVKALRDFRPRRSRPEPQEPSLQDLLFED